MGPSFMKTSSLFTSYWPLSLVRDQAPFCNSVAWMPSRWHHHLLLSRRLMMTPSGLSVLMSCWWLTVFYKGQDLG